MNEEMALKAAAYAYAAKFGWQKASEKLKQIANELSDTAWGR